MNVHGPILETAYKCSDRQHKYCSSVQGRESMSIRQEHEQELIKKSIRIDEKTGKAVASLASTEDPTIRPNRNIAENRQETMCNGPSKDPKVVDMISEGCNNLLVRDQLVPGENITQTHNLAFMKGSLLTHVHPHSQPPDEGKTFVNIDRKAELEVTSMCR